MTTTANPTTQPVRQGAKGTFGQMQLNNELKYIDKQLSAINQGTAVADQQTIILQSQRSSLVRWSAWLPAHFHPEPITPIAEQEYYEPSAALKHFWIGYWYEKSHVPFNMISTYPLEEFNLEAFKKTCDAITRRHEILRTIAVFCDDSRTVKQRILPVLDIDSVVKVIDISQENDQDAILDRHVAAAKAHIFAYERGPLLYFTVFKRGTRRYEVLFNVSHAIFDALSKNVFEEEFGLLYQAYCQGKPCQLKALPVQYKDYCAWEKRYQQTDLAVHYAEYWYSQSPDRYPARNLSTHFSNTPLSDFSYRDSLKRRIKPYLRWTDDKTIGAFYGVISKAERTYANAYRFPIGGDTFTRINAFCKQRCISPYHVIIAALNVLVYKTTGSRDIVLGAGVALRDRAEIQEVIGFFINTILIRNRLGEKNTFSNLITDVIIATTLASSYKNYTMPKVLDDMDIPSNAISTLFLNVLPSQEMATLTDFSKQHYDTGMPLGFDIDLKVRQYPNGLEFWCDYDFTIYSKEDITGLFDRFEEILKACLEDPHAALD